LRTVSKLLLAYFAFALVLSLAVGKEFLLQEVSVVENPEEVANALYLFAWILASVVIIFLVLRVYKGRKFFLLLELFLYFATVQIFFSLYLPEIPTLVLSALVIPLRLKFPKTRIFLLIFASALVGALLGASLDIIPVAVFSILLAAYDFIAVFKTKHMVSLAKQLEKRQAAFALFLSHKKEKIELGTGDVVIPSMIVVSALKLSSMHAIVSVVGAVIGLFTVVYLLEKKKGYYPALPPIVFFSLAFVLLYQALLLFKFV
jgi:presenilin-like A22 family membrane protease